jgi:hypothetical protein
MTIDFDSETHKYCHKCCLPKDKNEYNKNRARKDGIDVYCKKCSVLIRKERRNKSEEAKNKHNEQSKQYRQRNPEKVLQIGKNYREKHKDKLAEMRKSDKWKEYNKVFRREQRKNPIYRVRFNVSRQILHALKRVEGSKHGESVLSKLDYTPQQLKEHLESQFDEKMNWDNYGSYWHIDHIYPQSLLPYESLEDDNFKKCWELNNLRPLEAIENIKKSNKLTS